MLARCQDDTASSSSDGFYLINNQNRHFRQLLVAALVCTWGDVNTVSVFLQSSDLLLQFTLHSVKQQQLLTLGDRNKTQKTLKTISRRSYCGSVHPVKLVDTVALCISYTVKAKLYDNKMCSDSFVDPSPPSVGRQPGSHTHTCSSPTPSTALCRSLWQASKLKINMKQQEVKIWLLTAKKASFNSIVSISVHKIRHIKSDY